MYLEIDNLRIGGRESGLVITELDDTGIAYETTDVTIPNRPGLYLGKDRQSERTLTFTIRTGNGPRNLRQAQELADELTRVWRDSARKGPGELTEIVLETRPDRRRRVMGRCRKITPIVPDIRGMQGSVEILAEFVASDPVFYDEYDETFDISVLPQQQGGIIAPIVAPIQTSMWSGVGYRYVENAGDSPASMSVKFYGPASNPSLKVNGQEVALRGQLAYDETVTVNGRTGTVSNESGDNVSRLLTARTRLDALKLDPGSHEVSFTAEDVTNTARAEIIFSGAYNNL